MKLPAKMKNAERCDIGHLSVFTAYPLSIGLEVLKRTRKSRRNWGYCIVSKKRVYWVRYGFVNDPRAYTKK